MGHREYQKISDRKETAVLFVHGILGSPRHFDPLLSCVPPDWTVHCLLLDGHGMGVRDFSRSSMKKWQAQVTEAVEALASTHKRVLLVGHSMGTLFAIEQAAFCTDAVAGIFLLAAPLRVHIRLRLIPHLLRVWRDKPKKDDPVSVAFLQACSVRQDWRVWRYLGWIPRFLELLIQIRRTRKLLQQLRLPGIAVQSRRDEMVGLAACNELKDRMQVLVLENSTHFYYPEQDLTRLKDTFSEFCTQYSQK